MDPYSAIGSLVLNMAMGKKNASQQQAQQELAKPPMPIGGADVAKTPGPFGGTGLLPAGAPQPGLPGAGPSPQIMALGDLLLGRKPNDGF